MLSDKRGRDAGDGGRGDHCGVGPEHFRHSVVVDGLDRLSRSSVHHHLDSTVGLVDNCAQHFAFMIVEFVNFGSESDAHTVNATADGVFDFCPQISRMICPASLKGIWRIEKTPLNVRSAIT
jgi:hypothetical protein